MSVGGLDLCFFETFGQHCCCCFCIDVDADGAVFFWETHHFTHALDGDGAFNSVIASDDERARYCFSSGAFCKFIDGVLADRSGNNVWLGFYALWVEPVFCDCLFQNGAVYGLSVDGVVDHEGAGVDMQVSGNGISIEFADHAIKGRAEGCGIDGAHDGRFGFFEQRHEAGNGVPRLLAGAFDGCVPIDADAGGNWIKSGALLPCRHGDGLHHIIGQFGFQLCAGFLCTEVGNTDATDGCSTRDVVLVEENIDRIDACKNGNQTNENPD